MIDVLLLGCGATMPAPDRALSAAVLRCGGRCILFDCGEGTQASLRREKISPMKIDLIALTHYHGDHIFGLPGLLQTMSCLGRTESLFLTGPEALAEAMAPILSLAGELSFPVVPVSLSPEGEPLRRFSPLWSESTRLLAVPTAHRVPSQGYVFTLSRPPRFLPERAQALGVPVRLWKSLVGQAAASSVLVQGHVLLDENGIPVQVGQLFGQPRPGLKVAFSGDTAPCEAFTEAAAGADLLIHDATYALDEEAPEAALWGHSTFSQAAAVAASACCARLWLTHYSQALTQPELSLPIAAAVFPSAECGHDGKRITLAFRE